ncbi:hypothetical protein SEPCBS119000_005213 [Sporothrix epigloea]|uniref:Uncharacterized protein n=1 Tax=Sporothrix epigloea TaxID=1892477 RepID=A0ABP0DWD0_9PEZI
MTSIVSQTGADPPGITALTSDSQGCLQPQQAFAQNETLYASGCRELDCRVFGGCLYEGLGGGLVGLSAEGDVGLMLSLQVAVHRLHQNATATARLITTVPVEQVVRLLKGILRSHIWSATDDQGVNVTKAEKIKLPPSTRASILGRVLLSRVYGHDDLQAVLGELEECAPFQRLWSTDNSLPKTRSPQAKEGGETGDNGITSSSPPEIVIFTEIDHHFKWMRLQSNGGRLYELYGQLMRRLRALTTVSTDSGAHNRRRLIFVLTGTLMRRPAGSFSTASLATSASSSYLDGASDRQQAVQKEVADPDAVYRLALATLQRGLHSSRPDVLRLCCDELRKAQCIEPRYKVLMDYYCSLHICLTRLPGSLVDMWAGEEGSSTGPADSALWVATVESDEAEVSHRAGDRVGVIYQSHGTVRDASTS